VKETNDEWAGEEGAWLEMNLGTFVPRAVIGDDDMKELTGQVE
jgi:hypothetical protein